MTQTAILYPVFVQVFLTFFLQVWMRIERVGATKRGEVKFSDISLRQQKWPARATQIANAFHNQLETPILFYAVVAFLMITSQVNVVFVVLAWLFVAARLYHAYIHTGPNKQPHRSYAYLAGSFVLLVMWVLFAIRILFFSATGA
jgi:hypothetical protein